MDVLETCPCSGGTLPRFVQPVLLSLVFQEPLHGYAIARKLKETGLFGLQSPDITGIYRMLKEMKLNGILEEQAGPPGSGPARKYYAITPLGRQCLDRWISSLSSHHKQLNHVLRFMCSIRRAAS